MLNDDLALACMAATAVPASIVRESEFHVYVLHTDHVGNRRKALQYVNVSFQSSGRAYD